MKQTRMRKFFIEINPKANCFDKDPKKIEELIKKSKPNFYAEILHDKDTQEDGTIKQAHYHLIIEYPNAKSEQAIRAIFKGAHEEVAVNMGACAKYLLHETPNSIADGKHNYGLNEVLTNNQDYFSELKSQKTLEVFDPDELEKYYQEGTRGILAYYQRFGSAIKGYIQLIAQVERALICAEDAKSNEEQDQVNAQANHDLIDPSYLLNDENNDKH